MFGSLTTGVVGNWISSVRSVAGTRKILEFARTNGAPLMSSSLFRHEQGMEAAMGQLCAKADRAIQDGVNIIILSDRGIDREHAPIGDDRALSDVERR